LASALGLTVGAPVLILTGRSEPRIGAGKLKLVASCETLNPLARQDDYEFSTSFLAPRCRRAT
jgi:hypothetical protein